MPTAAGAWVLTGGAWKRKGRADRVSGLPAVPTFAPGSLPMGTASYPVPGNAIYVATTGNDTTGTGSAAAPYLTIKKAAAVAPANSTVVVRGGEYHEGGLYPNLGAGISVANPGVTIQNYPGEAVWLDGSVAVTNWTQSGAVWRAPFDLTLDRGKTQVRGEQVSSYGSFIVAEYPLASWPEMVLVDGVQLTQVDSLAQVGPTTFFVEGSSPNASGTDVNAFRSTAYVIGVNPAGREVRIGNLARVMSLGKTNLTFRGIGFRRYVCTLQDYGCIYTSSIPCAGFVMENCVIEDISDLGMEANALGGLYNRLTVQRCGRKGLGGSQHDGAIVQNSLFRHNNNRRFNYGPDGGGLKWGRAWDITVRFCEFDTNYGHDCWFDESVYRGKIHGNYFHGSHGKGAAYEIGDSGLIVDNIFVDQGIASTGISVRKPHDSNPVWISGSNRCRVWHNTIINPESAMRIAQDYRRPLAAGSFGRDPRQPDSFYQTEMTWDVQSVEVKNNVFIGTAGLNQVQSTFVSFFDVDFVKSTADYGPNFGGNLYTRPDSTHPNRFTMGYLGSQVVIYWDFTATPFGDTVIWTSRVADTGSKFIQNVSGATARARGVLDPTYLNQVTPAAVPTDVQALLDVSPFTHQRVGAGYLP